MKRLLRLTLFAGSAAAGGIILWGAGTASATEGDGGDGSGVAGTGQVQEVVVDNSTTQDGTADVTNAQINLNVPVAIASPGANSGPVDQSNEADNSAAVVNINDTEQSVGQSQDGSATATGGDAGGGGDGGDATAAVDQDQSASEANTSDQSGDASVENRQVNVNAPIAIGSPGANSGPVSQSNEADNSAVVINENSTEQSVGQSQAGDATATGGDASGGHGCGPCAGGHGGDGGDADATVDQAQSAGVSNDTTQGGSAAVDNAQQNANAASPHPAPAPHPAKAPSSGHGGGHDCGCQPTAGPVDQSNEADNSATVVNVNDTEQSVGQSQDGSATATGGDASSRGGGHPCGCEPSKSHKGGGGNDHPCGCEHNRGGDAGDGAAFVEQGQSARVGNATSQGGSATVDNTQENSNEAASRPTLRENSGGSCGCHPAPASGPVDQSNTADNTAVLINENSTDQRVGQSQDGSATATGGNARGGGDGGRGDATVDQVQHAGVGNETSQGGDATVGNTQENRNAPAKGAPHKGDPKQGKRCGCRHSTPAHPGPVDQSNAAENAAKVINRNSTDQRVGQSQDGSATASGGDASGGGHRPCGCDGGDKPHKPHPKPIPTLPTWSPVPGPILAI